jgi:hypothetical protein
MGRKRSEGREKEEENCKRRMEEKIDWQEKDLII